MKYAFASAEWFACLHGIISERAFAVGAAHPDLTYSICEVFIDAPADSPLTKGGQMAWYAVVKGQEVRFGLDEIDDVDFKVFIPFEEVPALARYDTRGDPDRAAELAGLVAEVVARGRFRSIGERSNSAEVIGSFHDAISRLTL